MTRPSLPHRRRAVTFGVVVPLLVTAAAWTLAGALLPRLPRPVAVHWGPDGTVDRVGTVGELLTVWGVLGGAWVLTLGALALTIGRTALTRRMVLALASGGAVYLAGIMLTQILTQVDRPAGEAASPDLGLILATLAAVAAGATAGWLGGADPAQPATAPLPADAPRAPLAPGERAVWIRTVSALPGLTRWGWPLVALYLAVAAWLGLATGMWFAPVLLLGLLPLLLTMLVWEVRVDAAGLTTRGAAGWPRQHVPAGEVLSAEVTRVRPFAEFGGWGLRTAPNGRTGVVLRRGQALEVRRTGGRRFVVTVDDAATAAALLTTYAERSGGRSRPGAPGVAAHRDPLG